MHKHCLWLRKDLESQRGLDCALSHDRVESLVYTGFHPVAAHKGVEYKNFVVATQESLSIPSSKQYLSSSYLPHQNHALLSISFSVLG
jgi:hypothetical protein